MGGFKITQHLQKYWNKIKTSPNFKYKKYETIKNETIKNM